MKNFHSVPALYQLRICYVPACRSKRIRFASNSVIGRFHTQDSMGEHYIYFENGLETHVYW